MSRILAYAIIGAVWYYYGDFVLIVVALVLVLIHLWIKASTGDWLA